ncbi:aspartyl-phosphate phosphatase Spo0E family protein [Clostridiaceae bacterium 35-E11]
MRKSRKLHQEIENIRKELMDLIEKSENDFYNDKILEKSKKLDELIVAYHHIHDQKFC